MPPDDPSATDREVLAWMVEHLARHTARAAGAIDVDAPFDALGLDSMEAVALTGELELQFAVRIDPTALWDHGTLRALAAHVAGVLRTTGGDLPEAEEDLDALLRALLEEGA